VPKCAKLLTMTKPDETSSELRWGALRLWHTRLWDVDSMAHEFVPRFSIDLT